MLKFTIHCYAYSQNKQQIPICKDDNDGLSYQVNCTPKLNVWAAKAAQELKNFAPAANRNNCFHKNESNSETVTKNSVWNISLFICKFQVMLYKKNAGTISIVHSKCQNKMTF